MAKVQINDRHAHFITLCENAEAKRGTPTPGIYRDLYNTLVQSEADNPPAAGGPIQVNLKTRTATHLESGRFVQLFEDKGHTCMVAGKALVYEGYTGRESFTKLYL